jgi:NTE family protein
MPTDNVKRIDMALQGGEAHSAFIWGVLDRLVDDAHIEIVGINGINAGAMNAIALAEGLADGGPQTARELLAGFRAKVSDSARMSPN